MKIHEEIVRLQKRRLNRLESLQDLLTDYKGHKLWDVFSRERKFLSLSCFYPVTENKVFFTLTSIVMNIYIMAGLFSLLGAAYNSRNDLAKLSEALLSGITVFAYFLKIVNFLSQRRILLIIEEYLKDPVLNNLSESDLIVIDSYVKPFVTFSNVFRSLAFSCSFFFAAFPYIDNDPNHLIPFPGWFPFDIKTYRLHITVMQQIYVIIAAFANSTLDISMMMLITIGSAHFDVLKNKLRNSTDFGDEEIDNEVVMNRLKLCVIQHNTLLEYINAIERTYNYGVFFQFLCTALVICMTLFQMAMIPLKSVQFLLLLFYFLTVFCQISLYCWYGNEIIHNSNGIGEACYLSDWNRCSPAVGKFFFIIMEKARKHVAVTAGNLFVLSLENLMAICRTSYSYFAVLQRIYNDN